MSSLCFSNHCSTVSAMSLFFAQSGQIISSLSVMKPLPTMDTLQEVHTKQSLCQCRPSNEMKRVPPMPGLRAKRAQSENGY